ncbi:MAG: uracil-DNA glycosylase [Bacteroidetes bacterium]|nr:uracil-DNA glycosylase [Bacteroidota bacterium]
MTIKKLQSEIISCKKCPRLIKWRKNISKEKVKRFAECEYWGKPVPGFGDPKASLLIIGLAPAAHGGNRTGRLFTGDRSGDWLFRTLNKFGYASKPESKNRHDGLKLKNCYITAACRCAPPQNKPLPSEIKNCRRYLLEELLLLKKITVIIGLGRIGFDAALNCLNDAYTIDHKRKPVFGHGSEYRMTERITLLGSFHPSQQNTFTGKLTKKMFNSIFRRASQLTSEISGHVLKKRRG